MYSSTATRAAVPSSSPSKSPPNTTDPPLTQANTTRLASSNNRYRLFTHASQCTTSCRVKREMVMALCTLGVRATLRGNATKAPASRQWRRAYCVMALFYGAFALLSTSMICQFLRCMAEPGCYMATRHAWCSCLGVVHRTWHTPFCVVRRTLVSILMSVSQILPVRVLSIRVLQAASYDRHCEVTAHLAREGNVPGMMTRPCLIDFHGRSAMSELRYVARISVVHVDAHVTNGSESLRSNAARTCTVARLYHAR